MQVFHHSAALSSMAAYSFKGGLISFITSTIPVSEPIDPAITNVVSRWIEYFIKLQEDKEAL